jgi:hypothetical protein
MNELIIFTHYGLSSYLKYTLEHSRKTNPDARLIFLGDKKNESIVKKNNWEHYDVKKLNKTELHQRFNNSYLDIQGAEHRSIRNGNNWLKYVFERWFYINDFCETNKIDRFWHFDSDTVILKNLNDYSYLFEKFDFSTQCNNICLNGIIKTEVVKEYCQLICELFEDQSFLKKQLDEFKHQNPKYAFTEMRAFEVYANKTRRKGIYLGSLINGQLFDDCICQEHGFKMINLPTGQTVKYLESSEKFVYGYRNGQKIEFITLNLSWVPNYVYRWVIATSIVEKSTLKNIKINILDYLMSYLVNKKIRLMKILK